MSVLVELRCDMPPHRRSGRCLTYMGTGPNRVSNSNADEIKRTIETVTNSAVNDGWQRIPFGYTYCPECLKGD